MDRSDEDRRHVEVSLVGTGGQGLVLIGLILAEAAGVHEGRRVVQTQNYGPESRGGRSRADVIISDAEIDYPEVEHPDILLALSQEAATAYVPSVRRGGTVIVDSRLVGAVPPVARARVYLLPLTELAQEKLGRALFANIVALGALIAITGIVSPDAIRKAVLARAPRGTEVRNSAALDIGLEVGHGATPQPVQPAYSTAK